MQATEMGPIASKAMETGGVAVALLLTLSACLCIVLWAVTRFWKQAIKPFMESLANIQTSHRETVREAKELAHDLRILHERKLLQSPPLSSARV